MSLFDKFDRLRDARGSLALDSDPSPLGTRIDEVYSPTLGRIGQHKVILAGTNNYLGLTFDPDCIAAAHRALDEAGTGTTGSRMANGSYGSHRQLEEELAEFYGMPSAMVFSTGYMANLGLISSLIGPGDSVVLDADCHASIYDACRMAGADVIRFRHNDASDLDKRLRRLADRREEGLDNTLIIVEGIYSMLGDSAPLAEIAEVKRRRGGYLLVDEAHSMGVMGATGRGLAEATGVEADVDFIVGTFSKSLGAIGGFAVSRHPELELVRFDSRPYIFTASPSPATIASVRQALAIVAQRPALRDQLWRNAERLYAGLHEQGFELGPTPGPVVAALVDSPRQAIAFWHALIEHGVYVNMMLPPASPNGRALMRISLSAAHSDEQVDSILGAFATLSPILDPSNSA
ncbi:serine palmitoyltransferase [Kushneria phosphatilytica]|uniref:Aminotransferase class I/II-fold pyridoxal phosphate-dependent enzyme n=1 Tax=Kushneria phosphatilytica TaxID=657387 RepID=A0A1S1NTS9_9GAMM|nr:aminotransferase class I/II-fold pyridoxal phosphate-dependent enzyme [Kushneria phosphatilytica]OHV07745.1 8-amino-7-oxononanoate synthase [Kushneria phosphatilytica]QEL10249.1 aminotransferase class I/II-fold pyridoxal phosphate-dependent enzyme [Kushneria phosphatilytica]